jgi:hypothetical protein
MVESTTLQSWCSEVHLSSNSTLEFRETLGPEGPPVGESSHDTSVLPGE